MAPLEPFDLADRSYGEIYELYEPPEYLRAAYNYGFEPMEPSHFTSLLGFDDSNLCSILKPDHCDSCHPWPCHCFPPNHPGNALQFKTQGTHTGFQPSVPRQTRPRNEASATQPQEMESSTRAGVTAATTTIFPANPYTEAKTTVNTTNDKTVTSAVHDVNENDMRNVVPSQSLFQTPNPSRYTNYLELSDVRDSVEDQYAGLGPDSAGRDVANILARGAHSLGLGAYLPINDDVFPDIGDPTLAPQQFDDDLHPNGLINGNFALEFSPQEERGYCKLQFEDGDVVINTEEVVLGRNMHVFEALRRKKKQQRRAHADLISYKQEPSQPSQHEDADQHGNPSSSSQSLEGRPAPPSNVSERGGVVSYQALADVSVDMRRSSRRKRRSLAMSKSSSTGSIDPTMIHGSITSDKKTTFGPDGKANGDKPFFIPIHPRIPEHITAISREHLKFFYNFDVACWQLHVMGNGAFVNEVFHERGSLVPRLDHEDEILVATVKLLFKLPDNVGGSPGISHGTFSKSDDDFSTEDDVVLSTSPARHLSNAMAAGDSDHDEIGAIEIVAQPKSKAKPVRKQEDLKKKKPKSKNERPEETLPNPTKKGKKPKTGDKSSAAAKEEKPPTPPVIEPGSTLEGIPLDELPQKRKGPGRPPKNGFVSKRDKGLVDKKRREYEKRGQEPPPFNDMVNMVRAETKAKEALQKALQNGEIAPGTSVVPSIETLPTYTAAKPASGPKATASGHNETSAEPGRKASPKPQKRTDKSPSPVLPEETFTEEQMKKPNSTYVHIIDEILREHPDQEADLPDIYLRIQKKYPHYKYRVPTAGWQSSVRHNLLQNARFTEKGKSGKGKFWAIDWDVPIEKEQKKRKTEPSMPRQMMHAQQPGQYGQPQYGNPYGNSQANGQAGPSYSSPYAQSGQNAQFGGQLQQQGVNAQRPNGGQPAKPKTLWEIMIDEFIRLHLQYQGTFRSQSIEVVARKEELWRLSLEKLSDAFQAAIDASTVVLPDPEDQEDAKMLTDLQDLFTNDRLRQAARQQHGTDQGKPSTTNQAVEHGAASAGEANQPDAAAIANQTVAGAPNAATRMGSSVPPPAVQAGSYLKNLNGGVSGGRAVTPFGFAPGVASGPAVSQPPTDPQQSFPGGAGTKRSADVSDDEPAAKKPKGE